MKTRLTCCAWRSALIALAVIGLATPAVAQTGAHQHETQAQAQPEAGKEMRDMKMGEKSAVDDRLADLTAQMKTAVGDAKIAAMSEALSLLVQERTAMHERCAMMMKMM